jgi:SAM-dependent methyltransferase
VLARRLSEAAALPPEGTLLDVGAGTGAMLAAFAKVVARWKVSALDLDKRSEPRLKRIPGFARLYTGAPEHMTDRFELITLIHSLEHLTGPLASLGAFRHLLAPGGLLFVEVNNAERMPFDLVVADHLCHFTPRSLGDLLGRSGFSAVRSSTQWINKEISLLARLGERRLERDDPGEALARTERDVAWLARMMEHAQDRAGDKSFGIFGTSIAATWLASGLGEALEFFVDEDPARTGRLHLGRPILTPAQVAPGSSVYLAFVDEVAASISRRLAHMPFRLVAPPARLA